MTRCLVALVITACALSAQSGGDPLDRARARILEAIDRLPRYTCTQTIDRTYFRQSRPDLKQHSCDQILANHTNGLSKLELTGTDRLRLDVEVAGGGYEVYSWPDGGPIDMERLEAVTGEGPIGTGAFGPFLINIFATDGVDLIAEGEQTIDGSPLLQYRYRVPLKASHYRVIARATTRTVPFDGRFWIHPVTAELVRLSVRTGELAPATGNCEATTTVDFTRARIGQGDYLLPLRGLLHVVRRDAAESENVTSYGSCREFRGESTVRYDIPSDATDGDAGAAQRAPPEPFPAAIPITIALTEPIDTGTSAAGDRVFGVISRPVAAPRHRGILASAGTRVRGRITALQHRFEPEPYFSITIAWEQMERNGRWAPLAARRDDPQVLLELRKLAPPAYNATRVQSRRVPPRGGTLVFQTSAPVYVVKAGHTSHWITVAPPKVGKVTAPRPLD